MVIECQFHKGILKLKVMWNWFIISIERASILKLVAVRKGRRWTFFIDTPFECYLNSVWKGPALLREFHFLEFSNWTCHGFGHPPRLISAQLHFKYCGHFKLYPERRLVDLKTRTKEGAMIPSTKSLRMQNEEKWRKRNMKNNKAKKTDNIYWIFFLHIFVLCFGLPWF